MKTMTMTIIAIKFKFDLKMNNANFEKRSDLKVNLIYLNTKIKYNNFNYFTKIYNYTLYNYIYLYIY